MDRHLERPQDREVAAARTPRRLDLRLVCVHLELEFHATASMILSEMSRQVKGSPSYFPKKWSGLYPVSARRRRVNCPYSSLRSRGFASRFSGGRGSLRCGTGT